MAKKSNKAQERKDKFYHLARETGYRSRAAFKLIQLNRKHHFLENSTVCIDLCSAPGSWLQVAQKNMPVSSIIIGVDLDPIRSIPNVITMKQDITTPECSSAIRKHLQGNKANLILNDGAPNVGTSWQQDAFNQVRLGLYGLRIAVDFLAVGGCLVTKVFRSSDYPKLLIKFREFFDRVTPTKPPASRTESAEIYVVCQDFKPPKKQDRPSLDPNIVFADNADPIDEDSANKEKRTISLSRLQKPITNREGYADGISVLHKSTKIAKFLKADDFMAVLADSNELAIDDDFVSQHPATTEEIVEYCKDLKLLGRSEIKQILRWRKRLIKDINENNKNANLANKEEGIVEDKTEEGDEDEIAEKNITEMIDKLTKQEAKELKKKSKKERKKVIEENKKVNKKISFRKDYFEQTEGLELFSLETLPSEIANKLQVDGVSDEEMVVEFDEDSVASTNYTVDDDEISQIGSPSADNVSLCEVESNNEKAEELSISNERKSNFDSGDESVDNTPIVIPRKSNKIDAAGYHDHRLTACERALARELIKSKKRRREIEESGFNRYSYDDEGTHLPSWFLEDERLHRRINVPVTREQVAIERERERAINARPPKKVLEAKVRRKKKLAAKLEIFRRKADTLAETDDITSVEKNKQIKEIYKKTGLLKQKPKTTLIPVKKGAGKRATRPSGVRGQFKLVDRKMKCDRGSKRQKKKGDRSKIKIRR